MWRNIRSGAFEVKHISPSDEMLVTASIKKSSECVAYMGDYGYALAACHAGVDLVPERAVH